MLPKPALTQHHSMLDSDIPAEIAKESVHPRMITRSGHELGEGPLEELLMGRNRWASPQVGGAGGGPTGGTRAAKMRNEGRFAPSCRRQS